MALYYITGMAGSGKSTLQTHLKYLGYLAYDGDHHGICHWYDAITHSRVQSPEHHTLDWLANHRWRIDRQRVIQILDAADDQPVFLCGTSMNDSDIIDLVDTVFFLEMDEATLRHRLATRTTSDWGKYPDELIHTLIHKESTEHYFRSLGAHFLPATTPTHELAVQILSYCNLNTAGQNAPYVATIATE